MSKQRKHLRGDNRITNALNRPIGGELGKKRSKAFVFFFGLFASIGLWWYSTSKLGLKVGTGVTLVAVGFVIFYHYEHKWFHADRTVKFFKEDE
ncbi:hypothetical protein [Marinobacter salarius]|jgi:hypothetical protein|uniref:hypothetical protein n=1 Tax=Marinobacter salarius TaxID=1420917 RepID=UPI0018F203F7|nr:hypothetical protein [Marinobacter salarius]MBJ7301705.1 hypothetical protein [Marinobacter salarius]HIO29936.1 hypothetical protein [Marinobacter salarius]HIP00303.1 hypothetical protein [Marinobacter salarius]